VTEEPAPRKAPGWVAASGNGAAVAAVMLALGEILALTDRVSLHLDLSLGETLRLGTFYLWLFHRGSVVWSISAAGGTANAQIYVSATFMLGTFLALWLLFRAGSRSAGEGGLLSRGLNGARIAPAYAALSLAAVALLAGDGQPARVLLFPGLLYPLVLATVAGFAGGAMTARDTVQGRQRRVLAVFAGGWAMLVYGIIASFVALMLLAALKPEYSRVYLAGFRAVRQRGGAAALINNAMTLPNESVWAMSASMGACDGVYGAVNVDALCYSHFPTGLSAPTDQAVPVPTTVPHIPLVLLIFVAVPPAAVLLGGAAGERFARTRRYREAALVGASSGLVFAPVMGLAALLAGVGLKYVGSGPLQGQAVFIGPNVLTSVLVAAAWGVPGGALGAITSRRLRLRDERSIVDDAGDDQDPANQPDPADDDPR